MVGYLAQLSSLPPILAPLSLPCFNLAPRCGCHILKRSVPDCCSQHNYHHVCCGARHPRVART